MVNTYADGRKTVCYRCTKRHPGCHNCEERQEEIKAEQAAKTEYREGFVYTENYYVQKKKKQQREKRGY